MCNLVLCKAMLHRLPKKEKNLYVLPQTVMLTVNHSEVHKHCENSNSTPDHENRKHTRKAPTPWGYTGPHSHRWQTSQSRWRSFLQNRSRGGKDRGVQGVRVGKGGGGGGVDGSARLT